MIRLEIISGVQKITEICDSCQCHIKDLETDDILVKTDADLIIKNSKGEEVTRTEPRDKCYCTDCGH